MRRWGSGFRVWGFGFRVQGWSWVEGLGSRVYLDHALKDVGAVRGGMSAW